jgi:type IV pilus assembly protein PilM
MEDYIIQYTVLEESEEPTTEASVERLRLMVVAYPKYMAQAYLSLLEEAELKAENLDVNFNAVNKLLKENTLINEENFTLEETSALIDMGAESIDINIYKDGKIDFSRIISEGGKDIDRHIAGKYDIDLEESEKRKKQYCDLLLSNEDFTLVEVNDLIREIVDRWIDELIRIIQFYRNRKLGNNIDKIYLYGGSSRLKGLEEYMSRALNIPVIKINTMSNLVLGKDVNKEDLDYYLNAIGSIIRL